MAKLTYPINVSLDGYMEDNRGNIEWNQVFRTSTRALPDFSGEPNRERTGEVAGP